MPNINAPAWKALLAHREQFAKAHLRDLFASDPQRFARFSVVLEGLLVDFSKQRIDATTLRLLIDLAETAKLGEWRDRLFSGDKINFSEKRAVMHPALRHLKLGAFPSAEWVVMPEVRAVRAQMRTFSEWVRGGLWRGFLFLGEALVSFPLFGNCCSDLLVPA